MISKLKIITKGTDFVNLTLINTQCLLIFDDLKIKFKKNYILQNSSPSGEGSPQMWQSPATPTALTTLGTIEKYYNLQTNKNFKFVINFHQ